MFGYTVTSVKTRESDYRILRDQMQDTNLTCLFYLEGFVVGGQQVCDAHGTTVSLEAPNTEFYHCVLGA